MSTSGPIGSVSTGWKPRPVDDFNFLAGWGNNPIKSKPHVHIPGKHKLTDDRPKKIKILKPKKTQSPTFAVKHQNTSKRPISMPTTSKIISSSSNILPPIIQQAQSMKKMVRSSVSTDTCDLEILPKAFYPIPPVDSPLHPNNVFSTAPIPSLVTIHPSFRKVLQKHHTTSNYQAGRQLITPETSTIHSATATTAHITSLNSEDCSVESVCTQGIHGFSVKSTSTWSETTEMGEKDALKTENNASKASSLTFTSGNMKLNGAATQQNDIFDLTKEGDEEIIQLSESKAIDVSKDEQENFQRDKNEERKTSFHAFASSVSGSDIDDDIPATKAINDRIAKISYKDELTTPFTSGFDCDINELEKSECKETFEDGALNDLMDENLHFSRLIDIDINCSFKHKKRKNNPEIFEAVSNDREFRNTHFYNATHHLQKGLNSPQPSLHNFQHHNLNKEKTLDLNVDRNMNLHNEDIYHMNNYSNSSSSSSESTSDDEQVHTSQVKIHIEDCNDTQEMVNGNNVLGRFNCMSPAFQIDPSLKITTKSRKASIQSIHNDAIGISQFSDDQTPDMTTESIDPELNALTSKSAAKDLLVSSKSPSFTQKTKNLLKNSPSRKKKETIIENKYQTTDVKSCSNPSGVDSVVSNDQRPQINENLLIRLGKNLNPLTRTTIANANIRQHRGRRSRVANLGFTGANSNHHNSQSCDFGAIKGFLDLFPEALLKRDSGLKDIFRSFSSFSDSMKPLEKHFINLAYIRNDTSTRPEVVRQCIQAFDVFQAQSKLQCSGSGGANIAANSRANTASAANAYGLVNSTSSSQACSKRGMSRGKKEKINNHGDALFDAFVTTINNKNLNLVNRSPNSILDLMGEPTPPNFDGILPHDSDEEQNSMESAVSEGFSGKLNGIDQNQPYYVKNEVYKRRLFRVAKHKSEVYGLVTSALLRDDGSSVSKKNVHKWAELPSCMDNLVSGYVWNLLWTWANPRIDYSKLLIVQKVNHYPFAKHLTRKDYLKKTLDRYHRSALVSASCSMNFNNVTGIQSSFGELNLASSQPQSPPQNVRMNLCDIFRLAPRTFVLPQEYASLVDEVASQHHIHNQAVQQHIKNNGTISTSNKSCMQSEETPASTPHPPLWILKPAGSSRGRGIKIVSQLSDIPCSTAQAVVQEYIRNPLLIRGHKCDLRLYVLVTSFQPLEAFIYRDGFARFAARPFSLDIDSTAERCVHLTNVAVNNHAALSKNNENTHDESCESDDRELVDSDNSAYDEDTEEDDNEFDNEVFDELEQEISLNKALTTEDKNNNKTVEHSLERLNRLLGGGDSPKVPTKQNKVTINKTKKYRKGLSSTDKAYGDSKVSLERFAELLAEEVNSPEGPNLFFKKIWPEIQELIVKSLCCANDLIPNCPSAFELFGYDVLLDSNLYPWLIEVNSSPSLSHDTPLDERVKNQLIEDTISLVDPPAFDRQALLRSLARRGMGSFNSNSHHSTNSNNSNSNKNGIMSSNAAANNESSSLVLDKWTELKEILGEDARIRMYGELPSRMGAFERVAPGPLWSKVLKLRGKIFSAPPPGENMH